VWLFVIWATVFTGTAVCTLAAFAMFDRLVRLEHARHHEAWIRDGKPIGFFWIPSDGNFFSGGFARNSLAMSWLFTSPGWVDEESEAKRALRWMRRLVFTSWMGWASFLLMFAFPV